MSPDGVERQYLGADSLTGWRHRLYVVIFQSNTPASRGFDVVLIIFILASVITVMMESVASIAQQYGRALYVAEWIFTALFTTEYLLRLICVGHPIRYARSFFGVVDLLAVIPTYISLLIPGAQFLLVIRLLRVLRVFRVLRLVRFISEANVLLAAVRASRRKITVFVLAVLTLVVILGSIMYLIEGPERGFTSIPRGIYWAVVTLTTVGYGDISPQTNIGQVLAAFVMIVGYAMIAVPTGIVTSEMTRLGMAGGQAVAPVRRCPACDATPHDPDAEFCKRCGGKLSFPQ